MTEHPSRASGLDLPAPGFGTSGHSGETCAESVCEAIEVGYRHIDTAQMYGNEREVGEGIAMADVDREDLVIATKVNPPNLASGDVIESTRKSLDRLGVETVDLLYVHWPTRAYDPEETLPAMDEVRDRGWTRHVGVSNFTPELLDEAREILDSPIAAHQVELHPLLRQERLREYAREHGHWLVAYCPILQGEADTVPVVCEIADKHEVTPSQVSLAWALHLDSVVPIPKATGEHIHENYAARTVELDAEDVEAIESIGDTRRLIDPDAAAWNR